MVINLQIAVQFLIDIDIKLNVMQKDNYKKERRIYFRESFISKKNIINE